MDLENTVKQSFEKNQIGKIYKNIIGRTEKYLIEKALQKAHGNQILAARILGLNRNTIRAKIRKLDIDLGDFK